MNPLAAILGVGEKLIDRLFPDPVKKAEALLELRRLEQSGDLAVIANQAEINKIEAASSSLFVAVIYSQKSRTRIIQNGNAGILNC